MGWVAFQNPDVSALLGISYEEEFFGQTMVFDIRYLYDLTDDFTNFGIRDLSLRHRNILISVGVEF
jgi:dihydroneopterin aldolase